MGSSGEQNREKKTRIRKKKQQSQKKRPRNWYFKDFTNEFIFLKRR